MTQKKSGTGDLSRDTLDMLILRTLSHGEMHGYDVAEYIQETSEEVLRVEEGALYPALHRLEIRGLLAAEWGASDNNRRAKYYRLTAAGGNSSRKKQRTGSACLPRLRGFWSLPEEDLCRTNG
jgi:PadR family transcriptional regulator PadR